MNRIIPCQPTCEEALWWRLRDLVLAANDVTARFAPARGVSEQWEELRWALRRAEKELRVLPSATDPRPSQPGSTRR